MLDNLLQRDSDQKILDEAKERYKYALSWETLARQRWRDDYKFSEGDSENLYQWPDQVVANRDDGKRPCLTVNMVRQHNLLIINDARQNKPRIRYSATGGEATFEVAKVLEGLARRIEYQSKAQVAYDQATGFQVKSGLGALRVETDYTDEETFDQDIFIRGVRDPLTILWDPDAVEPDKSDQRFCFVFENVPDDLFDQRYPQYRDLRNLTPFNNGPDDWITKDHVRVAEYWRRIEVEDELFLMVDPDSGRKLYARRSAVPENLIRQVLDDPQTRTRKLRRHEVQHFLIIGETIAKREPWAGKYIPIVPVIGEEIVIDGRLDRKGHTRAMKDSQRMFNYWLAEATAEIALQSKSPYVAPAAAIEGLESYWADANNTNSSVLPYNHIDDDGNEIPPPQRQEGPQVAAAYLQGMQWTTQNLMQVSGQYQAQLGAPSNERSGKAISERQRQGDNATYHFIDNLAIAIRQVGRIILDLIPHVYDQPRIMRILGEDGTEQQVLLDPQAQQAYAREAAEDAAAARAIFNPNIGQYDVEADIGPNFATARQEAWNAFVQIASANPQIMQIAGDLMFKAADFPMSDEIAERFKRTLPPGITGDGLPPALQQALQQAQQSIQMLLQQNQQLRAQLEGAAAKLTQKDLQLTAADQKRVIDAYNAETNRMKVIAGQIDPQQAAHLAAQLVLDALKTPVGPMMDAAERDLTGEAGSFGQNISLAGQALMQQLQQGNAPPQGPSISKMGDTLATPSDKGIPPGAKLSKDGNFYVEDPNRPGKHLLVVQ